MFSHLLPEIAHKSQIFICVPPTLRRKPVFLNYKNTARLEQLQLNASHQSILNYTEEFSSILSKIYPPGLSSDT